ncbi:hypothetical protein [Robiginitomaculum antarcticum]|uniref:hypothetical protein n=1 Tax=Robiginitomaculum antarcticum TaxID=437507 RepID=UPI000380B0D0|nr:hypothetical protein [Robiginitomaculum antarcticum]
MSIKKLAMAASAATLMTASTAYASVIDRPFFKVLGVVVVWGADDFAADATDGPVVSDFVLLTEGSGNAGKDLIGGTAADTFAVVTGDLDPVDGTTATGGGTIDPITGSTIGDTNSDGLLDAGDTLTAFGIDNTLDIDGALSNVHKGSFYVASNAAFDIYASSSNVVATGDFAGTTDALGVTTGNMTASNIKFSLGVATADSSSLSGVGDKAQDPSTGGTGIVTAINSLDDMASATKVFDGGRRTAASRGSIAQQSVRFDAQYSLIDPNAPGADKGYDLSMGSGTLQADVTYTVYVP